MSVPKVSFIDINQFKIVSSNEKTLGLIPRLGYINTYTHDTGSTNALFEGKKTIKEKASRSEYIDQAKVHINIIMTSLFETVGWSVAIDCTNA
jgi:hypothetical protein